MEKTLTIKELAPYLPFGLKAYFMGETDSEGKPTVYEIKGIEIMEDGIYVHGTDGQYLQQPPIFEVFPLLRPLSDLKGEVGLPSTIDDFVSGKGVKRVVDLPYWAITALLAEHYDIFRLIPAGLAQPLTN